MSKYQKEIIGINLLFISAFTLASLLGYSEAYQTGTPSTYGFGGDWGSFIADLMFWYYGTGSYILSIIPGFFGYLYFSHKEVICFKNLINLCYLIAVSIWISVFTYFLGIIFTKPLWQHFSGKLGNSISLFSIDVFGNFFSIVILFLSILVLNMVFFGYSIYDTLSLVWGKVCNQIKWVINRIKVLLSRSSQTSVVDTAEEISFNEDMENQDVDIKYDENVQENNDYFNDEDILDQDNLESTELEQPETSSNDSTIHSDEVSEDYETSNIEIEEEIEEEEIDIDLEKERKKKYFQYSLPQATLLNDPIEIGTKHSEEELHQKADGLIYALETFGVKGKVRRINQGPVITLFEIEPDEGVRVNKFTNLSDDLSRVMKASKVRVIAPIPGTRFVGIEIPNDSPAIVYLKNIITSEDYSNLSSKMTIGLGKTTSGKSFSFELDKMPHLLVAGATGSGKSVCINSIIASILYKAKPDEVKFILIDPKKVELSSYNALKDYHLITTSNLDEDVITKTENSTGILDSAITEMERRFEVFSAVKVRNISEYNKKSMKDSSLEKIPYIVVIIDELADLMMTSGRAIEDPITRLAQKARAIGIHLIVATQRPSVDVITGLIKSNFPARIAFQVSSKTDSRTIIDQNGAETLLGNGDMLFLPPGAATPMRLHGAFISLEEIEAILDHISKQPLPEKVFLPDTKSSKEESDFSIDDRDELLMDAARLVIQYQQASVSLLQRKFRIGYSRAGRIIDELESLGIVSGHSGSKARDVLVDESYLENIIK